MNRNLTENDGQAPLPRKSKKIYAAVSALLSLIGLAGLLVGYFTGGSSVGHSIAGGAPVLRGSLMGVVVETVRGSISMPAVDTGAGLVGYLPAALYFGIFLLIAAVCISFVLSIAAMLLPNSARVLALRNGRLLCFSYGILFAGNMLLYALRAEHLRADFFDLPIALTLLALFAVLVLTALAETPKKGALNLVLFLFSTVSLCAFIIPATPLLTAVNKLVLQGGASAFERVALILLCIVIFLNLAVSVLRLNAKRAYVLDILRYGVQFIGLIVLLCAYNPLRFFSDQPLSAVLLLLAPLGALGVSVFAANLFGKRLLRKKRIRKEETDALALDDEIPLNAS